MDATKAPYARPVQAPQAAKPTQAVKQAQSSNERSPKPDANAVKRSAYEQPKPTTNTRGEKLGQRLNAIA